MRKGSLNKHGLIRRMDRKNNSRKKVESDFFALRGRAE